MKNGELRSVPADLEDEAGDETGSIGFFTARRAIEKTILSLNQPGHRPASFAAVPCEMVQHREAAAVLQHPEDRSLPVISARVRRAVERVVAALDHSGPRRDAVAAASGETPEHRVIRAVLSHAENRPRTRATTGERRADQVVVRSSHQSAKWIPPIHKGLAETPQHLVGAAVPVDPKDDPAIRNATAGGRAIESAIAALDQRRERAEAVPIRTPEIPQDREPIAAIGNTKDGP